MEKQSIWSKFLGFLFPWHCVICFSWRVRGDLFSFLCARCFLKIRQNKNPLRPLKPFDRVLVYGPYADPILKALIFQFKFRFVKELAHPLGELLIAGLNEGGIESFLSGTTPVVTFIPLAPLRQNWRGFNQSQLLASAVASYFHLPCLPLLERSWLAPSQAKLKDEETRTKNIQGAFSLSAPHSSAPQKILLIDDVLTSGATLKQAGQVLKKWGVKELWGATITG